MKIPQYVIDNAKWRIKNQFGDFDVHNQRERVKRLEEQIKEYQEQLEKANKQLADDISVETELVEWLKSIGEYEEPKQPTT